MLLLEALDAHLTTEGLATSPAAPAAGLPVLHRAPRRGVPEPTADAPVQLGAYLTGGIAGRRYESWQRRQIIDLRVRAVSARDAELAVAPIIAELIDRRAWTMGGLRVIESLQWRELQLLRTGQDGYEFVTAFVFQLYA